MKELQCFGYSLTFEFIYTDDSPLIEQVRRYPGYENTYFNSTGQIVRV